MRATVWLPGERVGRFEISSYLVEPRAPAVTRIMGTCEIFEARFEMARQTFSYCGSCRLFRPVREAERLPWYGWWFDADGGMRAVEIASDAPLAFTAGLKLWQR
jgi:hypothetical protein